MNTCLNPPQPEPTVIYDYYSARKELEEAGFELVHHMSVFVVWKDKTRVYGANTIRDLRAFLEGWNLAQELR